MARPLTADELAQLGQSLLTPSALIEFGAFFGCLVLAWTVVRLLRGPQVDRSSIWFGRRIVDGVLFPVLALLLSLLARRLLQNALPVAAFHLIVPVLVSLVAIRLTVRVLRAAFKESRPVRIIERSVSWLAWVAVVLWITGVLPVLLDELEAIQWSIGDTRTSARNLIEGLLSAVVVMVIALWISAAIEARLLKGSGARLSMRKIAANMVRALLLFVGLLIALSVAGIDLTALGVFGGAIGVGIGFGLQKLAANYVSGFVILAEQSMRIGDMVMVDGFEGRITDISTRYTVIRALNGRESIVPNEMMITQRVENTTLADTKIVLTTMVQVAYGTDLDTLMPQLQTTVAAVPRVIDQPAPAIRLSNFAADGLELTIYFWIGDPENGSGNVRSEVNLAILRRLGELGVEIPFPQRVLHHRGRDPDQPGPTSTGGDGPGE